MFKPTERKGISKIAELTFRVTRERDTLYIKGVLTKFIQKEDNSFENILYKSETSSFLYVKHPFYETFQQKKDVPRGTSLLFFEV